MLSATRIVTTARPLLLLRSGGLGSKLFATEGGAAGPEGTDFSGPNLDGWKETWDFYSEFPRVTPLQSTTKAGNKAGPRGQSGASTHAAAGRRAEGRREEAGGGRLPWRRTSIWSRWKDSLFWSQLTGGAVSKVLLNALVQGRRVEPESPGMRCGDKRLSRGWPSDGAGHLLPVRSASSGSADSC